jgi:catechol 2,3-dioxygenase-like lactoylglutathione lyase family enzyme
MEYKVQNVTMKIGITDGEFTGSCIVYIPKENERFFTEWCGVKRNERYGVDEYEPEYESDYGPVFFNKTLNQYHADSPDTLITYLAWLFSEPGEQTIEVEYANPFWAIHDAEHAQNDEQGCTIYVDEHIEAKRLRAAFNLMKAHGFEATYDLIQEVEQAYRDRFGKDISFEEFLEYEDEDEEE